jgi:hypothetical protein
MIAESLTPKPGIREQYLPEGDIDRSPAQRAQKVTEGDLQAICYTNKRGAPYSASCIKSMLKGRSLNSN